MIQAAQFENWENYLYIHPRIIVDAVTFLIQYQGPAGDFHETPNFHINLNGKMRKKV